MTVFFERVSTDGEIKVSTFTGIISVHKKDNYPILDYGPQDVIICKFKSRNELSIAFFGSIKQRDAAYEVLMDKTTMTNIKVLDFTTYFDYAPYEDEYASQLMKESFGSFTLAKHFNKQFDLKPDLILSSAIKTLGPRFVSAITDNKPFLIERSKEYATLWSKTIWIPSLVTNKGISRRQFFEYLINKNNEKFNSSNHSI
jgi:hypothetical protein